MPDPVPLLLDTNAYFRLAQSIRPLLGVPFGKEQYCLYVLKEMQKEYKKSSRLKNKFPWVNTPEYSDNRAIKIPIKRTQKVEIDRAYDFILSYTRHVYPGVSQIDVLCLAYAEQLNIYVVTDDDDMLSVAKQYEIKALKTLELLKLMLDCEHIDMQKAREVAAYLVYQNDTPKNFRKDFKEIFVEEAPR